MSLNDSSERLNLTNFNDQTVHAVAGIGHPERFFSMLEAQGIKCVKHAFADHYAFKESDLLFKDDFPVLMTEKDAVKCVGMAVENAWYVPIDVVLSESADERLVQIINRVCNG